MQYGQVPGVTKPISRLVQGTVMVGSDHLKESFALLDEIRSLGCTTFDTGHVYGNGDNERTVGHWVRDRGVREDVVIIGKGAHHNRDRQRVTPYDIHADIADSLEKRTFRRLDLFVRLLEPMILLIMAVLVLAVVIALLVPVLKSSTAI